MDALLKRRVLLVAGKGGVGRTTTSGALALAGARSGKRVLLAEFEEPTRQLHSPLARLFGQQLMPSTPRALAPGVDGLMLQTRVGTELFLESVFRMQTLAKLAMRTPALLRLLHAAPSFHELGLYYHLLTQLRADDQGQPRYDLVVIDMPATGHALALTELPDALLRIVRSGPIADNLHAGQAIFNDPRQCVAAVVTLAEPLPVSESIELIEGLRRTRITVGAVIANRIPEDPFTPDERAAIDQMVAQLSTESGVYGLAEVDRIDRCAASLARLQAAVDLPLIQVGEQDATGPDAPRIVVDRIAGVLMVEAS